MNERIFELLKQATTNVNPQDREWVFSRVDQVKFAQLIVRECADYITEYYDSRDEAYYMKKHFGVEE